ASSSSPVLSETDNNARRITGSLMSIGPEGLGLRPDEKMPPAAYHKTRLPSKWPIAPRTAGSAAPLDFPPHLALAVARATQHDLQRAARTGEISTVEAVLDRDMRPLGREGPPFPVGQHDLDWTSARGAIAPDLRMEVEVDGKRQIGLQPQAPAEGPERIRSRQFVAVRIEHQAAPVDQPELSVIPVMPCRERNSAIGQMPDARADPAGKPDRCR